MRSTGMRGNGPAGGDAEAGPAARECRPAGSVPTLDHSRAQIAGVGPRRCQSPRLRCLVERCLIAVSGRGIALACSAGRSAGDMESPACGGLPKPKCLRDALPLRTLRVTEGWVNRFGEGSGGIGGGPARPDADAAAPPLRHCRRFLPNTLRTRSPSSSTSGHFDRGAGGDPVGRGRGPKPAWSCVETRIGPVNRPWLDGHFRARGNRTGG